MVIAIWTALGPERKDADFTAEAARSPNKPSKPESVFPSEDGRTCQAIEEPPTGPDQAKAIAAVIAVHAALAFIILSGLNGRMVGEAVDQLTTIRISEPPPPPPSAAAQTRAQARGDEENPKAQPRKRPRPVPIVAPKPKLPLSSPLPAAKIAGTGTATASGAASARSRHRRRRLGQRPGRRRLRRLFTFHARPALSNIPNRGISGARFDRAIPSGLVSSVDPGQS